MNSDVPSIDQMQLRIYQLLRACEDEGTSRQSFKDRVRSLLDDAGITDEVYYQQLFDIAAESAHRSNQLSSDILEANQFVEAQEVLRNCALQLDRASWRDTVLDAWPSPIAHEIDRLLVLLKSSVSPESVLLQMRDCFEVIVKLPTLILLRTIISQGGENADTTRRALFQHRTISSGTWNEISQKIAKLLIQKGQNSPVHKLARLLLKIVPLAHQFVEVRNDRIGHGARMLDPRELANLIEGCLIRGEYQKSDGKNAALASLNSILTEMVKLDAFKGLSIYASHHDTAVQLQGTSVIRNWLDDAQHQKLLHDDVEVPVYLKVDDLPDLPLAPFLSARVCKQCNNRDLFAFDSFNSKNNGQRFDFLDYARGHKMRMSTVDIPELARERPEDQTLHSSIIDDGSLSTASVLITLDKARVDRAYHSPEYLRGALRSFIQSNPGGVFWLQAPAHTGKTTFVQGLAEPEVKAEPINDRFGPKNGRIVAYYCRKEHRTGLPGLLNTLDRKLREVYEGWSDNKTPPDTVGVRDDPSPAAFIKWLESWRAFAEECRLALPGSPLMVIIDGLDELEPPTPGSALSILPTPAEAPDHLYLVLTSRVVGNAESPDFLRTFVQPKYQQT